MSSLPEASSDALAHSAQLSAMIHREIAASDGWITFARFMELALYAPGLGYYSAGSRKLGAAGDFVTAPEISGLFGQTLARQVAQIVQLTEGEILEVGAGSGRLALQLLLELDTLGALPAHYFILEVSANLRDRQQQLLARLAPHHLDRVQWVSAMPPSFTGVIIGNEVLDAMPAHLVAWRDNAVFERGVISQNNSFSWSEREPAHGHLFDAAQRIAPPAPYLSEINLAAPAFIASLADALQSGVILMIDYGFGASEYYHPQRSQGTLMCHYRHHAHADPFYLPGLQDITAHVDFSAVTQSGLSHGLELLGYTTQANFLINCGITEILGKTPAENTKAYFPLAAQAQKLLSPAEMGEVFKVVALGKNFDATLMGFARGDKSRLLDAG